MYSIRPYRPGDEPGIGNVIKTVYDEYGWPWQPDGHNRDSFEVQDHYYERGGGFWVLECCDEIVGTVGIRQIEEDVCDLCRLYLLPDHRGKGFGKKLYQHAIQEATKRGYTKMKIWSDKRLDVSHELYKRSGATSIGDRVVHDPNYPEIYEEWGYILDLYDA